MKYLNAFSVSCAQKVKVKNKEEVIKRRSLVVKCLRARERILRIILREDKKIRALFVTRAEDIDRLPDCPMMVKMPRARLRLSCAALKYITER